MLFVCWYCWRRVWFECLTCISPSFGARLLGHHGKESDSSITMTLNLSSRPSLPVVYVCTISFNKSWITTPLQKKSMCQKSAEAAYMYDTMWTHKPRTFKIDVPEILSEWTNSGGGKGRPKSLVWNYLLARETSMRWKELKAKFKAHIEYYSVKRINWL